MNPLKTMALQYWQFQVFMKTGTIRTNALRQLVATQAAKTAGAIWASGKDLRFQKGLSERPAVGT